MPIQVKGPDGATVEFPDGTPREEMERALRQHYGAPSQQTPDFSNVQGGAESSAVPQSRTFAQDLGRAAIMTGRNVVQGVAAPFELLHDAAIMTPVNAAASALGSDYRIAPAHQQLDANLNAIGIPNPQPENAIERIGSGIERAASGAGGFIGLGRALAGAASPVVSGIGQTMAANTGAQVAGAAGAGTGSELAREAGVGPWGQLGFGLLGSLVGAAPGLTAATVRGSLRGGEAGRQRMARNIEDFREAGTTPTVGQAAQNRRTQAAESLLSRAPGASGVMSNAAERQADQVASGMERIASRLAPNADPVKAGRVIERGVSGAGGFTDRFKAESGALYDKLDEFIPLTQRVDVSHTREALAKLNQLIPGAENVSRFFQNSRMKSIQGALEKDLGARPDLDETSEGVLAAIRRVDPAKADEWQAEIFRDEKLPYEALKKLRTLVGREMADAGLMSDVPRSKWKTLYAALSRDLETAANEAGPEASRAYNRATSYYNAGSSRLEALSRVVDKNGGPEAVFNAAISGTREGATTLRSVMQSLKPDERKVLAASMIRRLGKATPGQQNAEGDAFSMSTFLTNWNRLSPQAKSNLFGRFGNRLAGDMDKIARMADNVRSGSKVYANPSGTSGAISQMGTTAAFVLSLFGGNFNTAGGIALGAAGTNLSARLMTNPAFVRWLAKQSDVPLTSLSSSVGALYALARSNDDDDLKHAAELIQNSGQGQNGIAPENERRQDQ